jgi:hypothetical protein
VRSSWLSATLVERVRLLDALRRSPACRNRIAPWPTFFALKALTSAEEARIGALVKKAIED